jgi:beta-lactamase regulating signal transducer with metallopeptidase domain
MMSLPGAVEWLALFIEYLIKTTLALSICLLLVTIARRRAAAIRHFLLSSFLTGLLLLPVVSTFRLGWETDLLPVRVPMAMSQGAREKAGRLEGGISETARPFPTPLAAHAAGTSEPSVLPAPVQPSYHAPGALGIPRHLLPLLWSAGLAFLVLKLSLGILGAYRLTRAGSEVTDPAWRILLARLLAAIRIRRTVRLKSNGAIGIPITWGLFHPVILIPGCHEEWTEDQRSSALLHELCHVKRADWLIMFLVRLSLAVFWFNPLCWIVFRRLKREQERACDELVLTAGIKPSTYAATLLFFKHAAGMRRNVPAAFLGLVSGASFHQRLAAILRQKLTLKEVAMKTKITLAIAVMLVVALIGMARPPKAAAESPSNSSIHSMIAPQPANQDASASTATADKADQNPKVEVQKERDQKKGEQKRTIVIMNRQGEKIPIEITVVTGDTARKIIFEKPLTIKEGKQGELILLDREGKEVEILKGKPLHLKIEGKDLTIVKEGELLKIDEAGKLGLIFKPDAEGAGKFQVIPRVGIWKSEEGGAKKVDFYILKKGEDGQFIVGTADQDKVIVLKEKLKELQEQQGKDKLKEVGVALVQRVIEKLEARLVTLKKGKNIVLKLGDSPKTLTVVKPQGITVAGTGIRVMKDAGSKLAAIVAGDDAKIIILFWIKEGENSRAAYEQILARVRQELPAGFAVEPEYDEKSGAATLKITGAGTEKIPADLIKKIVELIKTEIKYPQ